MKGLSLAEEYYRQVGLPTLEKEFPQEISRMAFGMAGEGSDCFGYDDEISRDHDWGAGFCIWLTDEDYASFGKPLEEAYTRLPIDGYPVRNTSPQGEGRVGVIKISNFFYRYLGVTVPPENPVKWLQIPEEGLALVTNGRIFRDDLGELSRIRQDFSEGYPRDVWLKKLAAKLAKLARAGQYQLPRCKKRGDKVASLIALSDFLSAAMGVCYLLEGKYMPYFKWQRKGLEDLSLPQGLLPADFDTVIENNAMVEYICECIANELRNRGITNSKSSFLQDHSLEVYEQIQDPDLLQLHLLSE